MGAVDLDAVDWSSVAGSHRRGNGAIGALLTSGKVPLEKTLQEGQEGQMSA